MKLGLLAASLVLVAGGAVGCGDDDGSGGGDGAGDGSGKADAGASTEDFCAAFQAFSDDLTDVDGTEENFGEILKKGAQRIEDVGTPDGIPDDAEEGLQLTLDAIQDLPDDASAEDMSTLGDGLSDADKEKTDAFGDYLDETCPDLTEPGETQTDSGSSGSSDDPSDEASDGS